MRALICGFALLGSAWLGFTQTNSSLHISLDQIQTEISSTNWEVRMHLAEKLSSDHTEGTFRVLLSLLKDGSEDVSYAATESIEARKDKSFDHEFITAIKSLPRNDRWPTYRAARNYPTAAMWNFLRESLEEEIQFQNGRTAFDSRNCFYISHSLDEIGHSLEKGVKMQAPDTDDLKAYQKFAEELHRIN